jgi:hypothetical protein
MSEVYGQCAECGGTLTNGHVCPNKPLRACADGYGVGAPIPAALKKKPNQETTMNIDNDLIERVADIIQEAMVAHDCGMRTLHVPSKAQEIIALIQESQWISVEDELPEIGEEVIVYTPKCRDKVTALARLIRHEAATDYFWDNAYPLTGNCHVQDSVTHWQPLPLPPIGGSNGR